MQEIAVAGSSQPVLFSFLKASEMSEKPIMSIANDGGFHPLKGNIIGKLRKVGDFHLLKEI
jgi:hypothetical protein